MVGQVEILAENKGQNGLKEEQVELPEYIKILEKRFLTEENIDSFLAAQEPSILEYLH